MKQILEKLMAEIGDMVETNVLLKEHNTFGVGGICDFFYRAKSIEKMVTAINSAYNLNIPFLIIGSGSNILISDFGFPGMVIKNESNNIVVNAEIGEIIADSGVSMTKILNLAASAGLGGIEYMAGIPGTFGGALYGNAGGKRNWIGDYIKSVTVLEERKGELKVFKHSPEWMQFGYRETVIKKDYKDKKIKPIILTARLRLPQKRRDEIMKSIQENLDYRKTTQPLGQKTAGSFFKNPGEIKEQSAGYLLDHSGAKKMKVGGASVSRTHANFIVNQKDATAKDIRRLANLLKQQVFDTYRINLEEEIEYLGKW